MLKTRLLIALLFFTVIRIYAQEIKLPPELLWWIYEVKKANPNIEINKFKFEGKGTEKFGVNKIYQDSLIYPVFMRWNYSGYNVDLFIIEYKIINSNKTIERSYFEYEKALKNDDRFSLKLDWYEQRNDYFENR